MIMSISPAPLKGRICAPASKSYAHRVLICAALSDRDTDILCGPVCDDVQATMDCLQALGAGIQKTPKGFHVSPIRCTPEKAVLTCRESGSTLRFLLPVAGALGVEATFQMEGRLPLRPLSPLWEELQRMGCQLSRPTDHTILCKGQLRGGQYQMEGSVSSQFITGLRLSMLRLPGSTLTVTGPVASRPYLDMTEDVLGLFPARKPIAIEADWSGASFFLAANALGAEIEISGLNSRSCQGDKAIVVLLENLQANITISAENVPDLVPILAVIAAFGKGAVFTDTARLRLKESDRVQAVCNMINSLGGLAYADENTLTICPQPLMGGTVNPQKDHRIAMAAAIAAIGCQNTVTISDADCVSKSYPQFWEDYEHLGGKLCASTVSE